MCRDCKIVDAGFGHAFGYAERCKIELCDECRAIEDLAERVGGEPLTPEEFEERDRRILASILAEGAP